MEEYDVIVIGAGASGIAAGYKVQAELPDARYAILEAREVLGGTWNFFKYPGLRSDSYLSSFGFRWRPWREEKEIADGAAIQRYMEECAASQGIDKHILYKHRVVAAHWRSDESRWTLDVEVNGDEEPDLKTFKAGFIVACSGYYDYKTPLQAEIPGLSAFKGTVVHPQFWPEDLDYTNRRIVIIGSGATAVTILPVLAQKAAKVTMLQRSPSYIMPLKARPGQVSLARKLLPSRLADIVNFWQDVLFQYFVKLFCFTWPKLARRLMIKAMAKELKGSGIPVDPHFTPTYYPWTQRVCACPDGDFYDALRRGNCDVVTDRIEAVTESGISTKSGKTIDADIVITATGLRIQILGGVDVSVDGRRFNIPEQFAWRNFMLEGVPNMAMVIGYTNMAWTLGSDACLMLMMRIIKHMRKIGAITVTPVVENRESLPSKPIIEMKSTYFVSAYDCLPRKTNVDPWTERKGYIQEWLLGKFGSISSLTKGLVFSSGEASPQAKDQASGQVNGSTKGHLMDGHAKAD